MRQDDGLAFLLKYENVAWYQDGAVSILDRRVYPAKTQYVKCQDYLAVADAIRDMVTQSGGPWMAAAWGMVSAARGVRDRPAAEAKDGLRKAACALSHARPTTSAGMAAHVNRVLAAAECAVDQGVDVERATYDFAFAQIEERYRMSHRAAAFCVSMFPDDSTVLTQCFAETVIGFMILAAREAGKRMALICPETRPYLQGARLTASVAYDMGVPTTVITDNMPAYALSRGQVDAFISGADVVTLDGFVVNKVGTLQIALAAHFFKVPYYVFGRPSSANPSISAVQIEERDPEETVHFMGIRTATQGVRGFYPAFDITPPELVSAVITSQGVFSPYDLRAHFGST